MKSRTGIILIVLILVAGAIGYYIGTRNKSADIPADEAITNEGTVNTNTIIDLSQVNANLTGDELVQAQTRDEKRVNDIRSIQAALEKYKNDKGAYPEALTGVVPDYLDGLPGNPSPGGITYTYTPIGSAPYTYYDLSYVLEVGVDDITIGDHSATPDGVATP
ncbi:MAG: hypothetical protein A2898_03525 [Candidatus Kerfeldbacteria bacterium RIFCSPLOWO2_01_FULL_48_11]|uniref:Type II secretion system protein GspG C-terminal domain-containing protein n=1 Tax=Candidatus Kerfeldbacteria bacterium RIFCSPLOWO2_01_FULL_48_11 TaxID=1798543 RepID=A0A1G2B3W3_9BACT|nr:MAG: hypothetical protein UY34_C0010G0010 [Parcubacteria group bacterium GW2011_GWA2_48_9]KKW16262.1 MAG: hypothetical protein UY52_C0007G0022 [Parcubacteria group bacterium GW2011_GWC2_49_9]OGY83329.1 MAG: hypothetical protein A2898_03525 [Candidatus Kerfeldbacteria bacterium RIFCSPLOWO2_01_FULL_48_11]HCJ52124.1 hypothetical protein [Candidatus Kerfeldbacteria bacterium]HCM68748.1 hypothetical protein [Candidatus Kerfeldbacteria bacterium]